MKRRLLGGVAISAAIVAIGATQIRHAEGIRYSPYRDIGGVWTVCHGHTGPDVKPGQQWTQAQCDAVTKADYEREAATTQTCLQVDLTPGEQIAFYDFAYNVGGLAFCRSTMAREINAGHKDAACKALLRWIYVGKIDCRTAGSKCPGIVKRRQWEYDRCMG